MERKTRQHQAIFEVMVSAQHPLLAQEIWGLASTQVPQLSVATVYRQLKSLQDEGLIKAVVLPGQNPRYELASLAHHHHFQCRACERVFDLDACPGNLDRLAPSGFRVDDHELILYGRCSDCVSPPEARLAP
jgi:Fur family transcriptional regulator, ferric uptake regulator